MALEFLALGYRLIPTASATTPGAALAATIYGPQPPRAQRAPCRPMPPAAAHRESRASDVLGHVRATAAPTSEARPAQTELFASEARK